MGITTPQKLWISLSTVHYCFMVITRVFSVIFLYTASLFCVVLLQPRCSGGHYRENNPLSFLQVAVADNNYTALQPTQHINNKIPFSSFFFLFFLLSSLLSLSLSSRLRQWAKAERGCYLVFGSISIKLVLILILLRFEPFFPGWVFQFYLKH